LTLTTQELNFLVVAEKVGASKQAGAFSFPVVATCHAARE